ncbi:MAG: UDP-glucuronic acid decarboxylase family protein [Pseudomonadota bacterium]|nr:UDP-glucuronic acid decarboxylase family protein [Pseudomonadota bacterium]
MKHILITGGAGFIGSHLTEFLLKSGHHVTVVDNLQTGSLSNLAFCKDHPDFSFIQQDVCDPLDLEVDEIYHLACPASPVHYQADPVKTTKTCVLGSLNVLELAKKNRCRLLSASTSEVYGDPLVHPQVESDWGNVNPVGIRSCYDEGKRCAETLFMDYNRQYGVDVVIARIFNTYGPRMSLEDGRVIPNFIAQALKNESLTLYGDGSQTRSLCYVDDMVKGLTSMMALGKPHTGPYNVGNPVENTVKQIAEVIINLTNSTSDMITKPLPQDDPVRRCPDISKLHEATGFKPSVMLNDGLKQTIAYFESKLGICIK